VTVYTRTAADQMTIIGSTVTVGTDGYMIVEETRTTDRSYERLPSETESQQAPDFTITAESPRISTDATPTNFQGWYYGGRTTGSRT
jgi:hypothetical protein